MIGRLDAADRVDGLQESGRPRHAARKLTAALGMLVLLAFAACGGVAPAPPIVVTIGSAAGSVVVGEPVQFHVSANPAPRADLTVRVTIASTGCELAQSPESVTIAAGDSRATLTVAIGGVAVGANGCEVTARIAAGEGYEVGAGAGAASTTLTMRPVVTVTADSASVTKGSPVSFTLTASPPPV